MRLRKIQLDYDKLKSLPRLGKGKVLEAGDNARAILSSPQHIFQGFMQSADHPRRGEGWLCYAGTPEWCYEDDGTRTKSPPGEVFVVFVTREWIAYNWYWVEADNQGLPKDHGSRFERRLI